MIRKFCNACDKAMDLNSGYEMEFHNRSERCHFCNWDCATRFEVPEPLGGLPSVKSVKSLWDGKISLTFTNLTEAADRTAR